MADKTFYLTINEGEPYSIPLGGFGSYQVAWRYLPGTATPFEDYKPETVGFHFPHPDEQIYVLAIDDKIGEDLPETFTVQLNASYTLNGATTLFTYDYVFTIAANEGQPLNEKAKEAASNLWTTLKAKAEARWEEVKNWPAAIGEGLKNMAEWVWDGIARQVSDAFGGSNARASAVSATFDGEAYDAQQTAEIGQRMDALASYLAPTSRSILEEMVGSVRYHYQSEPDTYSSNTTLDGFTAPLTASVGIKDSYFGSSGTDIINSLDLDDFIYGAGGDDNLRGGNGADTLVGGSGSDLMFGGAENDSLWGNDGEDRLRGDAGDDNLFGGAGIDTVVGGLGRDVMSGGSGADLFDFNKISESVRGSRRDVIEGFETGSDRIDLSTIDASSGVQGNQKFFWVDGANLSAGFTDEAGQLRFVRGRLQGDTNGDGKADFELRVLGSLSAADVIL